ncbi:hypothetical protein os1_24390 [Comamonadaceae bacterium OS-1]|nr:hypothetical protein os1_24390 [Comamonadaceae bacterium OS-1]
MGQGIARWCRHIRHQTQELFKVFSLAQGNDKAQVVKIHAALHTITVPPPARRLSAPERGRINISTSRLSRVM